jgi:hypothetical protein
VNPINAIADLFNAEKRRGRQLEDLNRKLTDLRAEYAAAIEADDDSAQDKVHTKIEGVQASIRAARAAVAATQARAVNRRTADDAEARRKLKAEADAAIEAAWLGTIAFGDAVEKAGAMHLQSEKLWEAVRAKGHAAGMSDEDLQSMCVPPVKAWVMAFKKLVRDVHAARMPASPLLLPSVPGPPNMPAFRELKARMADKPEPVPQPLPEGA